jgi:hypothetical protein
MSDVKFGGLPDPFRYWGNLEEGEALDLIPLFEIAVRGHKLTETGDVEYAEQMLLDLQSGKAVGQIHCRGDDERGGKTLDTLIAKIEASLTEAEQVAVKKYRQERPNTATEQGIIDGYIKLIEESRND